MYQRSWEKRRSERRVKKKIFIPGGAANFIINESKAKALISHKVLAQNQSNFHTKSFNWWSLRATNLNDICRPDGLLDLPVGRVVDFFLLTTRMPYISGAIKVITLKNCKVIAKRTRYLCGKIVSCNTFSVKHSFHLKKRKLEKTAYFVLFCAKPNIRSKIGENVIFLNKCKCP